MTNGWRRVGTERGVPANYPFSEREIVLSSAFNGYASSFS